MENTEKRQKQLSSRQQQILDFLHNYSARTGYSPTIKEIADEIGMKSMSSVHYQLNQLDEAGYIRREANRDRSIRLTNYDSQMSDYVQALTDGCKNGALSYISVESLPFQLPDRDSYIAFKCAKKEIEGTNAGDVYVFQKTDEANRGDYVLISYKNENYVRKFTIQKGHVWLCADEDLEPIDGAEADILGVLSFSVRLYQTQVQTRI